MEALRTRPPRNTGPLEWRDYGPNGGRLGTFEDGYDGSPWELHRGELVEQIGSKDIHGVVMALIAALFRTHARRGLRTMTDVYCDLTDEKGPSVRAPDVVLVGDATPPKDDFVRVTPILAVEVRATQSRKHLDEKVKLYLEHDWPLLWIAHAERQELEVVEAGLATVVYRPGAEVPLPSSLDKHGLRSLPVAALFDETLSERYTDGWVRLRALEHLFVRRLGRALSGAELVVLHDRMSVLGPEQVTDAALDLDLAALAGWLSTR